MRRTIGSRIWNALGYPAHGGQADRLAKADAPESQAWLRWDETRFGETRRYLEGKAPASYTLDDWLLLAEWLVNGYCPDGVIHSAAEYMKVGTALMGKIQAAAIGLEATPKQIGDLLEVAPIASPRTHPRVLTPAEAVNLYMDQLEADESNGITKDSDKNKFQQILCEYREAEAVGAKEGSIWHLRSRLFDNFATLNQDFECIAVTASGEMHNQAFIAGVAPGRKVRRQEAYRGACPFCRSISGRVFNVVAADDPARDGWQDVWVGKSNAGRSENRFKIGENGLVARSEGELWWPAAGLQHKMCRGAWSLVVERPPNVGEEFYSWMDARLKRAIPTYRSPTDVGPYEDTEDDDG